MLNQISLHQIRTSKLKCIEYEIGMFLCLLSKEDEIGQVYNAISSRSNSDKIIAISRAANKESILNILSYAGLKFEDVSFETQNDELGPADIVIYARNRHNDLKKIGLSVKYNNECICNYSSSHILPKGTILKLKKELPKYADRYLQEMIQRFGTFDEWYNARYIKKKRIKSDITNEYIDLIRDAVITRWSKMSIIQRSDFLYTVYRTDSQLDYWIYSFLDNDAFILSTNPPYVRQASYANVSVKKMAHQYIGFYLGDQLIGKTQIKFNDGIFTRYKSERYKKAIESNDTDAITLLLNDFVRKKQGVVIDGKPLKYGDPFNSWNYLISY